LTETPPDSVRARKRRPRTWVILVLITLWGTVLYYRMEVRAYWWVHQLQQASTPEERRYYTLCLTSIRDSSLYALPALLRDPRPEIRILGVEALRDCHSLRAQKLLLNALHDESDPVVVRAALMLSLRRDPTTFVLDRLREDRLGKNLRFASAAILAFERIGGPMAVEGVLADRDPSSDPNLLAQAMDSLASLDCRTEFRFLIGMLTDRRPVTVPPFSCRMAVEAIARLQGGEVAKGIDRQALLVATRAPPTVGAAAARSLCLLTGQSFGDPASRPAEGGHAIQHQWYTWLDRHERGADATSQPATLPQ